MKEDADRNVRVKCLRRGDFLHVADTSGLTLFCCAGRVALHKQGETSRQYLAEGQELASDHVGPVTISFLGGPKNEWLEEMGIAVIALSRDCP